MTLPFVFEDSQDYQAYQALLNQQAQIISQICKDNNISPDQVSSYKIQDECVILLPAQPNGKEYIIKVPE
jgi:hypothetical protein